MIQLHVASTRLLVATFPDSLRMFKPRQASASAPSASPPSIEAVRKRAKHRLLGVTVLVLAGVVVFPMLFDTQPRPIPVDVVIEIPDRQSAPALDASAQAQASSPAGGSAAQSSGKPVADDEVVISGSMRAVQPAEAGSSSARSAVAPASKPVTAVAPSASPKPSASATPAKPSVPPPPPAATAAKSAPVSVAKPAEQKPAAPAIPADETSAEAARAQALLEGKSAPAPAPVPRTEATDGQRFIVQVGAYAESSRAQQVRNQLERAGLKTYTHVAETAEGKRIRVRLGPFSTRAEADRAASKAKAVGVSAAILTL